MISERLVRVVMVDDHVVVRDGLRTLLELSGFVQVVGTAVSAEEALDVVSSTPCDLVLVDVELPLNDGIWCTRELKAVHPGLRVLLLTMHSDERLVVEALEAGADGYLLKSASRDEVLRAMRDVCEGQSHIDPRLAGMLVTKLRRTSPDPARTDSVLLSRRERQILTMAAEGLNNKEIAERLGVAQNTIKTHLRSIYRKCGVPDRLQAVLYALRNGFVSAP